MTVILLALKVVVAFVLVEAMFVLLFSRWIASHKCKKLKFKLILFHVKCVSFPGP